MLRNAPPSPDGPPAARDTGSRIKAGQPLPPLSDRRASPRAGAEVKSSSRGAQRGRPSSSSETRQPSYVASTARPARAHVQANVGVKEARLPAERPAALGIECTDMVHFTHWEPGGEYVKIISVKNIAMRTQKVRYRLPRTRFFSMDFPKSVTLSAGMRLAVPITFRPVSKENYADVVEFIASSGSFSLPVQATLPMHQLEFPSRIDFGFCPVRETAVRTFSVRNAGELTTELSWAVGTPFRISPERLMLAPGASAQVSLSFTPQNASVFEMSALCTFGGRPDDENAASSENGSLPLRVLGSGKFSFLAIDVPAGTVQDDAAGEGAGRRTRQSAAPAAVRSAQADEDDAMGHCLNFGAAFAGTTVERTFQLQNPSPVAANFTVRPSAGETPTGFFKFSRTAGVVPAGGAIEMSVSFAATAAQLTTHDYYDIATVSGNVLRVACVGRGKGPAVTLSTQLINFGDTETGVPVLRAFHLHNASGMAAQYQFQLEAHSTFQIDKQSGVIPAHSTLDLMVRFAPSDAMNYLRTVYCLVMHQDALAIDLLGTAFDAKRRPATFQTAFLDNYRFRLESAGLWAYSPEQLEAMIKNGILSETNGRIAYASDALHDEAVATLAAAAAAAPSSPAQLPDRAFSEHAQVEAYFFDNFGPSRPVTVLDSFIDFGACRRGMPIDSAVVRIANNTKAKITCAWVLPGAGAAPQHYPFVVTPRTADIPPQSVGEFRVNFDPDSDNCYFGQQLECYAYFKSMRNFRLVNEITFTPPWCVTATFSGNTFAAAADSLIPTVQVDRLRLDFPACLAAQQAAFQLVRVTNDGDTPVRFRFSPSGAGARVPNGSSIGVMALPQLVSGAGEPFLVKPACGVIPRNGSQLVVCRFAPRAERRFEGRLQLACNSGNGGEQLLQLVGLGSLPQIRFEPDAATLIQRPISVGAAAQRHLLLRNTSRIPVEYAWRVPDAFADTVALVPSSGTLAPNAQVAVVCTVVPASARKMLVRLGCSFWSMAAPKGNMAFSRSTRTLTLAVEGISGRLFGTPTQLDLGHILVNSRTEQQLTIMNPYDCDMHYLLETTLTSRAVRFAHDTQEQDDDAADAAGNGPVMGRVLVATSFGATAAQQKLEKQALNGASVSDELVVVQPSHVLPAKSRHRIKVVAYLQTQRIYSLDIRYRLESVDRAAALQATGPRAPAPPVHLLPPEPTRLCRIQVTGVLPAIKVVDIQADGHSRKSLWDAFHVPELNQLLNQLHAQPRQRTPTARPSPERLATPSALPGAHQARPIEFNFGAQLLGSAPTTVSLALRNLGVVPVTCLICFPSDLAVQPEQWVDTAEGAPKPPLASERASGAAGGSAVVPHHHNHTQQDAQWATLERAVFSIPTRRLVMAPGESAAVTLCCRHDLVGRHSLPVVCRLKDESDSDCHDILLQLTGRTIGPRQTHLQIAASAAHSIPLAIGDTHPPVQSLRLCNPSALPLEWEVDLSMVDPQDIELGVFSCPRISGYLPSGTVDDLDFVFRPLEARMHSFPLCVRFGGAGGHSAGLAPAGTSKRSQGAANHSRQSSGAMGLLSATSSSGLTHQGGAESGDRQHYVTIHGQGLGGGAAADARALDAFAALENLPQDDSGALPITTMRLSARQVVFGNVPLGTTSRRVLTLHNPTKEAQLSFRWHVDPTHEHLLEIEPRHGDLAPGESRLCKLVLRAGFVCRWLAFPIELEVVNQRDMVEYDLLLEQLRTKARASRMLASMTQMSGNMSTDLRASTTQPPSPRRRSVAAASPAPGSLRHRRPPAGVPVARVSSASLPGVSVSEDQAAALGSSGDTLGNLATSRYAILPGIAAGSSSASPADDARPAPSRRVSVATSAAAAPSPAASNDVEEEATPELEPPIPIRLCVDVYARVYHADDAARRLVPPSESAPFVERLRRNTPLGSSVYGQLTYGDVELLGSVLEDLLDDIQMDTDLLARVRPETSPLSQLALWARASAAELCELAAQPPALPVSPALDATWSAIVRSAAAFRGEQREGKFHALYGPDEALPDRIAAEPALASPVDELVYDGLSRDDAVLGLSLLSRQAHALPNLVEDILENTLFNILQEAVDGEFAVTSLPRLVNVAASEVAVPPGGSQPFSSVAGASVGH